MVGNISTVNSYDQLLIVNITLESIGGPDGMYVLLRIPTVPLKPAEFKLIKSDSSSKRSSKSNGKVTANAQLDAVIRAIEDKHNPTSKVANDWKVSPHIYLILLLKQLILFAPMFTGISQYIS